MTTTTSRRALLGAGVAISVGTVAACTGASSKPHPGMDGMANMPGMNGTSTAAGTTATLVAPNGPQVQAAEAARKGTGRTVPAKLTAVAGTVDLGGVKAATWTFERALDKLSPVSGLILR